MPHRLPHHRRSVRLALHDYAAGLYFVTIVTAGRRPLFGSIAGVGVDRSPFGDIAHDLWVGTPDHFATIVSDAFIVMPDHVHLLFGIADGALGDRHAPDHRRGTACCAPTPNAPTAGSTVTPGTTAPPPNAPTAGPTVTPGTTAPPPNAPTAGPTVTPGTTAPPPNAPTAGSIATPGNHPTRRFGAMTPATVPVIVRSYKSAVTRAICAADGAPGRIWQRGYHDRVVRTAREAEHVRRYIHDNPARRRRRRP